VQLGLLEQVQVDGREAQVAQAALDLVAQEGCVQAVHPVHDVVGVDESRLDVGLEQVASRVPARGEQIGIHGEVAALRHDHDLVACGAALAKRALERRPQTALARVHAVRERRIEDVDAPREQLQHRGAVQHVVDAPRLAVSHAECKRRQGQAIRPAKVSLAIGEALGEASRAVGRGASRRRIGARHRRRG
jgi:hypothetical protein